jgi:hypothetical protein
MLSAQVESPNEFGEALTADEVAGMKHRRAHSESKAGCSRDPGALPGKNQVVGKEVNKTTQESSEGPMRSPSAAETAGTASILRDFIRVVCTWHLFHESQLTCGEFGRWQMSKSSHLALSSCCEIAAPHEQHL